MPVLGLLAHDSGGELTAHECFGPLFSNSLQAALTRRFGLRGMLDCYVSDGVRLVQWMGPVDVLQVCIMYASGTACAVLSVHL